MVRCCPSTRGGCRRHTKVLHRPPTLCPPVYDRTRGNRSVLAEHVSNRGLHHSVYHHPPSCDRPHVRLGACLVRSIRNLDRSSPACSSTRSCRPTHQIHRGYRPTCGTFASSDQTLDTLVFCAYSYSCVSPSC